MGKCNLHSWEGSPQVDYCYLCEQEQYKNVMIKTIKCPKDDITASVMQDLTTRADRGLMKYNTTLGENNHQNMLQHAYEEALDMAQYLKKEITTLSTIQDLVKEYPNDAELGMKLRQMYGKA
jgi:hypothetical protein